MKFVGGTRHGQDAPEWVRALVVVGQREFDIEEHTPSGGDPSTPRRIERYVVRTWTTAEGHCFRTLAIAGMESDCVDSMAAPRF